MMPNSFERELADFNEVSRVVKQKPKSFATKRQLEILKSIPSYAFPKDFALYADGKLEDHLSSAGYVSSNDPNTVNWFDETSNTLYHEMEHIRQSQHKDLFNKNKSGYSMGAIGNSDYWKLNEGLRKIGTDRLVKDYSFGYNWNENSHEVFANITAYMMDNLKKGIPFTQTPLAKEIGITTASELADFVYSHSLIGQDKLYNLPPENTNFIDDILKWLSER
jgi:hypothetical protein